MKTNTLRLSAFALVAALALGTTTDTAKAAGAAPVPPAQEWSFDGPFGRFDRAQLRRGFQVFKEVCNACHSLDLVAYRNLRDIGFSEDEVKAIAAEYEVKAGPNDEGEVLEDGDFRMRPALPSDRFNAPFPNKQAARASNNGALPPDLSLLTKARKKGPDYLYALLTGYHDEVPADFQTSYKAAHEGAEFALGDGMSFNTYFPGNAIAMGPPLSEDAVEYADGTKASLEQLSKDVTVFLHWAAEPKLEERKILGVKVIIFLIVLSALMYALKREIWRDVH